MHFMNICCRTDVCFGDADIGAAGLGTLTLSEELVKTMTIVPAPVMSLAWPCHGTAINRESVLLVSLRLPKAVVVIGLRHNRVASRNGVRSTVAANGGGGTGSQGPI